MTRLSRTDLARIIVQLMDKGTDLHQLAREVAEFLLAERRTREVDALLRTVAAVREQTGGVVEANVSSAHKLDDKLKNMIKELFVAKKVVLDCQIDKSVLGGARIETQDRLLDISIAHELSQLKSTVLPGAGV